jgi:hypothetical protein
MNAAPIEPRPWRRPRWAMLIAVVFAAHLGLVFGLGDRSPMVVRQLSAVPVLRLATGPDEWLSLSDPTLFTLPHRKGFAGAAWLQIPPVPFHAFEWTEPPRWLAMPVDQPGAQLARLLETNGFASFQLELNPAPELTVPELEPEPALAARSELRLEGGLAQRRLLNVMELPSLPGSDLLTNSVVQVLADRAGDTVSVTLLPPGSGSKEADQRALELAKAARFEPLPRDGAGGSANPAAGLSWGRMIFQWHTVPLAETNAPAGAP